MSPPASTAFVLVIAGTSGAGKTSLVRKTAELLGAAASLHFDDYRAVSRYPPDLAAWVAAGADPDEWRTPQLAADLRALRQGQPVSLPGDRGTLQPQPYLVVEDPFGRARREMAPSIDFVVYLDLPIDVAMARKLRREVNGTARDDGLQAALDCLNEFLTGFLEGSWRELYLAANRSARESCDLVLDGMRPLEDLAREIVGRVPAC